MSSLDDESIDTERSRDVVLRRGTTATALLRRAARVAHEDSLPVSSLPPILRPRGGAEAGEGGLFSVVIRLSFLLIFVIPALLIGVYYGLIASGQYSSEMRFAVKNGEASALEQTGALGAGSQLAALSLAQDTIVITDYIKSRPMVEQLQSELDIRAMFSRSDIDFLSAFSADDSIEGLVEYWQSHVRVSIDAMSGLVTVGVRAFQPQDALAITQAIGRHSEELVNEMSKRTTEDLLKDTQAELARAEARLQETRGKLQALRNAEGTLDPDASASGMNELLSALRQAKAEAEAQMASMGGLSASSPQMKPIRARIAALDAQIAKIEAEMTGGTDGGDLSGVMTRFDELELENQVAERRYAAAATAMEAARLAAERRRVYITPFVEAQLPEEATSPSRLLHIVAGFGGSFFAWAAFAGLAVFVRRRVL